MVSSDFYQIFQKSCQPPIWPSKEHPRCFPWIGRILMPPHSRYDRKSKSQVTPAGVNRLHPEILEGRKACISWQDFCGLMSCKVRWEKGQCHQVGGILVHIWWQRLGGSGWLSERAQGWGHRLWVRGGPSMRTCISVPCHCEVWEGWGVCKHRLIVRKEGAGRCTLRASAATTCSQPGCSGSCSHH